MFKNKIKLTIFILFLSFFLTGCTLEKTRNEIIDKLKAESVIKDDWDLLYLDIKNASPIPAIIGYDYIYIDSSYEDEDFNEIGEIDKGVKLISIKKTDSNKYEVIISEEVDIIKEKRESLDKENNLQEKIVYHVRKYDNNRKFLLEYEKVFIFKVLHITEK